jgi:hypothetical protein
LGLPVVPEVKASSAMSSAAVGQGLKPAALPAARASRACGSAGALKDVPELACPQQRHGRHRDGAGLHHRQPGQRHADRVAATQQHAVAGSYAQVLDQHAADAVDAVTRFLVAEGER